ncbi:uncharacterized protein MAM_01987 [Metarhizium album ARSEF 1941]|uniref:SUZ RNA-binding domain-containing n=1 Tax=Metarhizium album (strain ARSEF 1941) TaxID=1081103 RepID=A0A0B2X154_METAS|nr:uncharacterized protein MAM_01987 [Metarhizium album ARSEF 1941]KHO00064.1 hypothetical protein MAM_01987 [Metarhizium album ARSEF 1941]
MNRSGIPDAWDDDWEAQADRAAVEDDENHQQGGVSLHAAQSLTKAERITQHEEANRKMWESADATPQTFHYLEASNTVPLTSAFKPQVKVLSRKPVIAKRDATTGMSRLSMDDDDSEMERPQRTAEEIRAKQKRDLEEKQRRYDEARAKIFGQSNPSSRGSSPGTVTPPRGESRHSGRGRGRGGGGQRNNGANTNDGGRQPDMRRANNQASSGRELYDPKFSPKPDLTAQRRAGGDIDCGPGRATTLRDEHHLLQAQQPQQAIRMPRGPDGTGRGGFGFARRGGKES